MLKLYDAKKNERVRSLLKEIFTDGFAAEHKPVEEKCSDMEENMSISTSALLENSLLKGLASETGSQTKTGSNTESFEALLNSAMGMIKETENYTNLAEEAELSYMLGLNDSVTDLLAAQTKANISLQYTVAVRNAVLDAYKEIMALQF